MSKAVENFLEKYRRIAHIGKVIRKIDFLGYKQTVLVLSEEEVNILRHEGFEVKPRQNDRHYHISWQ